MIEVKTGAGAVIADKAMAVKKAEIAAEAEVKEPVMVDQEIKAKAIL